MVMLTCREKVTLQTVRFVKNGLLFTLCFIVAFWFSKYGMFLYPLTTWGVEHFYQIFSQYQSDIYEAGTDPVTFTSLMAIIAIYALVLFLLVKKVIIKLKNYFSVKKTRL